MSGSTPSTSRRNSDNFQDASDGQPHMEKELKTLNLSNPAQMVIIDKLRELGLQKVVNLPQLVVVGDQSSGKSSVLEAIMDFPIPRGSGLCTRFATNIILKRSAITSASISIIPGVSRGFPPTLEFDSFHKSFKSLDGETFVNIVDQASRAMGITEVDGKQTLHNRTFSDDILKIELSGPHHDNLSVIDVPGIFRNAEGKTTQEDIDLVNRLVHSYIQDERTIILAVLAANVDLANQEILGMARKADPKGIRTLGVLTKPDLVDEGAEENIIALFQGKGNKLALGYCILRNRGQKEQKSSFSQRFENEREFFLRSPWNTIDQDRVGIQSLKSRLQTLLADMIKREFPKLKFHIDARLRSAKSTLKELGSERDSPGQQRRFLEDIAKKFQEIRADTMDRIYFRHDILMKNESLRLPTLVADEFDNLVVQFKKYGHRINFDDPDESKSENEDEDETEAQADVAENSDSESCSDAASITKTSFRDERYPELQDIEIDASYQDITNQISAKKWIEKEYLSTRGYSLEVMNANTLPLLWRTQSQNWLQVTKVFTGNIIMLVHHYIHQLLAILCGDTRMMEELRNFLLDDIMARYKTSLAQIELIIKIERHGSLITQNHHFGENLKKIRSQLREAELEADMEEVDWKNANGGSFPRQMISVHKLRESETHKTNLKQAVDDLHSNLMVYYKVARARVIDNIIQSVDYFLLTGENSPLNILTPLYISSLSIENLDQIAGEDMMSKNKRRELNSLIAKLEDGSKAIRGQ